MAQFDIIAPTIKAYSISWAERNYLVRLAMVPLLLKIGGYLTGFSMGFQGNQIALTLCLLPAYFAEGWMLSHFVRLITLGHRWPFRPSGNFEADLAVLRTRARGVMSGVVSYVLINMALGGIMAAIMTVMPDPSQDPETIPPQTGVALIMILVSFVWLFRLTWLYIPLALNLSGEKYLHAVRGYLTSLPMIGVWILCAVPFLIGFGFLEGLFKQIAGDSAIVGFIFVLIVVVADTVKNIVASAGLTYLMQDIYKVRGGGEGAA